ncbi:MAG: alpha/beta fold hydrolase [Hyphomicrobiaceae bacterium]
MIDLIETPLNPIPPQGQVFAVGGQGPELRGAVWPATRLDARGTIILLQGRAEFIEKYYETVSDLRRRGFAVATFDWRGQGASERLLSDPLKGHVTSFDDYLDDLSRFVEDLQTRGLPRPWAVLGHSMGGHLAVRKAAVRPGLFDQIVVTAPLVAIAPARLGMSEAAAAGIARTATLAGFSSTYVPGGGARLLHEMPFDENILTRDATRLARNAEVTALTPQLRLGDPTIGWLDAAFRSMRVLSTADFVDRMRTPLLCLVASRDRIVSGRAAEELCDRLKLAACLTLVGAEHEILQETDSIRSQFWTAFDTFLGESLEPQQAIADRFVAVRS